MQSQAVLSICSSVCGKLQTGFFFLMIGWCRSGDGEGGGGGGLEMHVKTVGDSACVKLFFHCVELPHLSYQIIVGESA